MSLADVTERRWTSRLAPTGNLGINPNVKHGRWLHCPLNDKLYNFGGDWSAPLANDTGRQEVWSYDPALDNNTGDGSGWVLEHDYCAAAGGIVPANPDQVTTVWDSNRNKFWILPGNMQGAQTPAVLDMTLAAGGSETEILCHANNGAAALDWTATNRWAVITNDDLSYELIAYTSIDNSALPNRLLGCTRGFGGTPKHAHPVGDILNQTANSPCGTGTIRASIGRVPYSFNPLTGAYTLEGEPGLIPTGEGLSNGFFDPVEDKILRITGSGPFTVTKFDPANGLTRTTQSFSGLGFSPERIGWEDIAFDPVNRIAYIISPNLGRMWKYVCATNTMSIVGATPRQWTLTEGSSIGMNCAYPKWDSVNNVLLWPAVRSFSSGRADAPPAPCDLWIYHPDSNSWEHDDMLPATPVQAGNMWVFHPTYNILVGYGRGDESHVFFYRYGGAPGGGGIPTSVSVTVS